MLCAFFERTVPLRAIGFTFRFNQRTCHSSTSRSHFYSVPMANLQKPSSQSKKRLFKGKFIPSSHCLDLKKTLDSEDPIPHRKKRQKLDSGKSNDIPSPSSSKPVPGNSLPAKLPPELARHRTDQGGRDENSRVSLVTMALALEEKFSDKQYHNLTFLALFSTIPSYSPGRYLALDCEMVGVGINASESSLARVSLVNYHGVVIMDEYVKQRERVVDYRTRWSGIRPSNMINAKPFEEVQKAVHELLDGRTLIGHAVYNDLKALLLSHPTRQTRDTQGYAYKFALTKSRQISLKNLAKQELGIDIQTGEHSSVVDARVTMAIYRLHKKDWEQASGTFSQIPGPETAKRRSTEVVETNGLSELDGESATLESNSEKEKVEENPPTADMYRKKRAKTNRGPTSSYPGGGRKGVSSGLSTVVRRSERGAEAVGETPKSKHPWWKSLPSGGAKGYARLDG